MLPQPTRSKLEVCIQDWLGEEFGLRPQRPQLVVKHQPTTTDVRKESETSKWVSPPLNGANTGSQSCDSDDP